MKIGVTNLKGGVGKTTISLNLSVCFTHMDYTVALIDTDTNQNSVSWYEVRDNSLPKVEVWPYTNPNTLLQKVDILHATNDIILLDGTPNLGIMTTKIMGASDLLIIPIRPGANDFRSLYEFYNRYQEVKAVRPNLSAYFLLNEYDERFILHRSVRENLLEYYSDIPHLKTMLKSRTVYGECVLNGCGVYEGTDIRAKTEMIQLTQEIIALAQQHNLMQ